MFDLEDDNNIYLSTLDKERILAMVLGDSIDAECGFFTVFLYRDGYNLFFTCQQRQDNHVFKMAKELFYFIDELA